MKCPTSIQSGRSLMVEHNLAKVNTRVRFPSPAPKASLVEAFLFLGSLQFFLKKLALFPGTGYNVFNVNKLVE
jgi:hypothetical protein